MIQINKIVCSVLDENCYIVYDDITLDTIIIDPGSDFKKINDFIVLKKLNVLAVLLTHGHFDHIYSCKKLQDLGYKIYISKQDCDMCNNAQLNFSQDNGYEIDKFVPDFIIDNISELTFGTIKVLIIYVAGHSKGGLAFVIENNLFSGDTLFACGYGRTDLQGGNFREILTSIKTLRSYTKNGYNLYPGHDY